MLRTDLDLIPATFGEECMRVIAPLVIMPINPGAAQDDVDQAPEGAPARDHVVWPERPD